MRSTIILVGIFLFLYFNVVLYTVIKFKNYNLKAKSIKVIIETPYLIYKASISASINMVKDNQESMDFKSWAKAILFGVAMYSVASSLTAKMYVIHYEQIQKYGHSFAEVADGRVDKSNNSESDLSRRLIGTFDNDVRNDNYVIA